MIGWRFNKQPAPAAAEAPPPAIATATAAAPPRPGAAAADELAAQLQAALGDDDALLALAHADVPLQTKLAAVAALAGEAALKSAERGFRDHDRRVHRLAKQRHQACVAQREARAGAAQLIEAAGALLNEPLIAANRVVDIDRAWCALDAALLDPTQRSAYAELSARLTQLMAERAEAERQLKRWNEHARQARRGLLEACAACAAGSPERDHLAALRDAAARACEAAPPGDDTAALRTALDEALLDAERLDAKLAVLDTLNPATAAPADDSLPAAEGHPTPATLIERWQALPAPVEAALSAALEQRFEAALALIEQTRSARREQQRERAKDRKLATRNERSATAAQRLDQAEAALAAGQLGEVHRQLIEIDTLVHAGADAQALRNRIDTLQARYAELKGWQHWAGGRARDELVLQAQALAAATRSDGRAPALKLSIAQRAELIADMRARWGELDRLGGATSRTLWQSFEAALKQAHEPVAAHADAQRAARTQNLQARHQLLETLDAVVLPESAPGDAAAAWRAPAAAFDRFALDWRKLGPLEHTVPHAARAGLMQRLQTSSARIETPLQQARGAAQQARQGLVDRARALAAQAAAGTLARDLVAQVRELQSAWQPAAAALPLGRAAEQALWSAFKSAIDEAFGAREAVLSAHEAAWRANAAERAALIEGLHALHADTPAAELKRALAEADAQWQRCGPPPRNDAARLEARYRAAHEAVRGHLAGSTQRRWQGVCDALTAKLALCTAREDGQQDDDDALAQRWSASAGLPPPWEAALRARAGLPASAPAAAVAKLALATDALLLQLEATWELPSPPGQQAARREWKLLALKRTMEGQRSAAPPPPETCLAALIGRAGLDTAQRARLAALVAALRMRAPLVVA